MSDRAGIFDNDKDFDVSGFEPKKSKPADKKIPIETVRAVSEAANFPSRDPSASAAAPAAAPAVSAPAPAAAPAKPAAKRKRRRYRTGRNVQLNIKVKAETVDAFYALADSQGWVLGETLERAIDALKASLKSKR